MKGPEKVLLFPDNATYLDMIRINKERAHEATAKAEGRQ